MNVNKIMTIHVNMIITIQINMRFSCYNDSIVFAIGIIILMSRITITISTVNNNMIIIINTVVLLLP